MFQGLLLMPWFYVGICVGMLLCLLAGEIGVMARLPASFLCFVASLTLLAAAACWLAIRDFEQARHEPGLDGRPN
jgi:hypothetical protein